MDYETLENPDIQIKKERAGNTTDGFLNIVDQLYALISSVIILISISYIISTLNSFLIIFVVCILYLNTVFTKRVNKKLYDLGVELSKFDKYQGAYSYMLNYPEYAKEIRLFKIQDFLINLYARSKVNSIKLEIKHYSVRTSPSLFNSVTNFVQQSVLYIYLIICVINKKFGIGNFTIYLSAVGQFSSSLSGVFNSYLDLSNKSFEIDEFIKFMEIENRQEKSGNKIPIFDQNSVIEFVNVSFKYPGSDYFALKNFNLTICGKEKLCVVGENGSGKSTFIKLLCRLYFPTEGKILLNGVNIYEYDYEKYQRLFAPVFQDYAKYYMTLGENISLTHNYDINNLEKICGENGLLPMIKKLKNGYNTQIGKWIDPEGIDPSGGEEQRMAIARACYHSGKIFLLDEPTAALDPMAEYEIYTQFNNMITDKCAILITHRLSAVQLADKVAVFDGGQVVEYGTHKELYAKGGIYTEMFDKQAQFYRDDTGSV